MDFNPGLTKWITTQFILSLPNVNCNRGPGHNSLMPFSGPHRQKKSHWCPYFLLSSGLAKKKKPGLWESLPSPSPAYRSKETPGMVQRPPVAPSLWLPATPAYGQPSRPLDFGAWRPFHHLINNPVIDSVFPEDRFITLSSTVCGGNYKDNGKSSTNGGFCIAN